MVQFIPTFTKGVIFLILIYTAMALLAINMQHLLHK